MFRPGSLAILVFLALPAIIQAQMSAPTPATEERRIVTGDPIPVSESEGAARCYSWTKELMDSQGASTPIESLRRVPYFVGTTRTENDSFGGDGTASINLYGLGALNVVTLINGRRAFGFSDINAIPLSALSRTEILDGNAYGSDSTGGVANFVLLNGPGEKPYEGAELHALYGNTTEADAHVRQVHVRGGLTGLNGKVSIAAAGEYYSRANLFARDREISRTADSSNDTTGLGLGGPNRNSALFAGRISLSGPTSAGGGPRVLVDLMENAPTASSYRAFDMPPGIDPNRFNSRAITPTIPAVEKAMFFVTGRYKIFREGLQLYGDLLYSKTKQDNAISPTPISFANVGNGLNEVRSSPFNPFRGSTLTSLQYRTLQEIGLRKSFYDRDYYRYTAGLNGDFEFNDNKFLSRFGYDTGFVYDRFNQVRTDSGAPTYTNGTQTGTRAYDNIAAAQAASYIGRSLSSERAFLYDAKANANLFPELWNGGIDIAAIYERWEINSRQLPDPVQASRDAIGFTPASGRSRENVESRSVEVYVPIVTTAMGMPWVRSLDLGVHWRREEYHVTNLLLETGSPPRTSTSFTNANPGEDFGGAVQGFLRYQPTQDLMIRASWRQSIRPPAFAELFTPVEQTFPVILGGGIGIPSPPNDGIFVGGNPKLTPEKTDSYSVGIVWNPQFVPGLVVTADAYQLYTKDVIVDPASFTQGMLVNGIIDPDGCGLGVVAGGPGVGLTRNLGGSLDCIDSPYSNAGKRLVQGVEATMVYEIPTDRWGQFTFTGGWNHFFTWKGQAGPGTPTVSFLGNYNNQTIPFVPGAIPWNKGYLRGEWAVKGFDFFVTGNYIGDFRDDPSFDTVVRDHRRNVPSYITLDLQLSYEWKRPRLEPIENEAKESAQNISARTDSSGSSIWQRLLWGTKVTVGVDNAFDRNPPTVLAALNDNYDTSLYSIRNRYWYIGVAKKF